MKKKKEEAIVTISASTPWRSNGRRPEDKALMSTRESDRSQMWLMLSSIACSRACLIARTSAMQAEEIWSWNREPLFRSDPSWFEKIQAKLPFLVYLFQAAFVLHRIVWGWRRSGSIGRLRFEVGGGGWGDGLDMCLVPFSDCSDRFEYYFKARRCFLLEEELVPRYPDEPADPWKSIAGEAIRGESFPLVGWHDGWFYWGTSLRIKGVWPRP